MCGRQEVGLGRGRGKREDTNEGLRLLEGRENVDLGLHLNGATGDGGCHSVMKKHHVGLFVVRAAYNVKGLVNHE